MSTITHVRHTTTTAPGAPLDEFPHWLMCRTEDDDGSGFWTVLGVNDPVEGDAVARAFQRVAAPLTTRCELIRNDESSFVAWTKRVGLGNLAGVRR